jgi:hypothetical protein
MSSKSKKSTSAPNPVPAKNELSETELAQASGGFNPQPDPPAAIARLIVQLPRQIG